MVLLIFLFVMLYILALLYAWPFFKNWMPDIVTSIFFCARYLCIPINIAELCLGTQLSKDKQFDGFKSDF